MEQILDNPYLWTGLSLAVLVVIAFKFARTPLQGWLDSEINKIKQELEQAQKLRAEAEQLLASYKLKEQEALREAAALIAQAEREAQNLRANAARELQDSLVRHEQQAVDRIARAEAEAIAEVRHAVINLASAASAYVLQEQMTTAQADGYVDGVIAALPSQLRQKSVA
jgi:F-type H+-transporting ATPase subunit b